MATDPNIKIKLAATGAPAAVKEIDKVDASIEDLGKKSAETRALFDQLAAALDRAADEAEAAAAKELREAAAALEVVEDKAVAATNAQKQLAAAGPNVAKSQSNAGLAVLEFARAIEDAQYGIRGVINNIPTLVSYMGAGAGLAGAISLAAVAAAQLLPLLMDLGSASKEEAERFQEAQAAAADAAEKLEKRLESLRQARADADAANVLDLGTAAVQRWNNETAALDRTVAAYRAYQSAKLEELSAAAAIDTARVNADEAANRISRADAIAARAAITEKAEAEALRVRQAAADQEIAFAERRLALAATAQADLDKSAANARRQADAAVAAAMAGEQTGPAFNAAQQRLGNASRARQLAQGSVSALSMSSYGRETPQLAQARAELQAAREEEIRAKEALAAAQQALDSTDMEALRAREAAAVAALDAADKAKKAGDDRLANLREEVAQETELIRLRQRSAAEIAAMRSTERGIQTGSAVATEQARAAEMARAQQADAAALQLAEQIRNQVAGANAASDSTGLIPVLMEVAQLFSNGTNANEQAQAIAMLSTALGRLQQDQAASRALLNQVMEQIRNNPAR